MRSLLLLGVISAQLMLVSAAINYPTQVLDGDQCASDVWKASSDGEIRKILQLSGLPQVKTTQMDFPCGGPGWTRIVFLNMSDPTHECPDAWYEHIDPRRVCGRQPQDSGSSCDTLTLSVYGMQYSRVCGRAIGYPNGTVEAFYVYNNNPTGLLSTLEGPYVDGISITHGYPPPRTHIWTFAAGRSETYNNTYECPCRGQSRAVSPPFVGNNYFCEAGSWDDPLWDGDGCRLSMCCSFNSPPWFNIQLPEPTTNNIDVRICGSTIARYEDTPIELLELYIQ